MTHKTERRECNLAFRNTSMMVALLSVALYCSEASADMPQMSEDGWHSWLVQAHGEATDWCCFSWSGGEVRSSGCNLDAGERHHGTLSSDATHGVVTHPQKMQIYARIAGGSAAELRTYSTSCPVTSNAIVVDHGQLDAADSVAWLSRQIGADSKLSSDALAAIAVHKGNEARRTLVATARSDSRLENRKHAVFWMGQTRGLETGDDIKALMFSDDSAQMREHAAFALSQSNATGRLEALSRLGNTDRDRDVRGKAWFWLAQSGEPGSEAAMLSALEAEQSGNVREELIFAMSQLPDDAGTDALIAVIENRQLPDELRKRALFWIAQDGSDRGIEYLSAVFER